MATKPLIDITFPQIDNTTYTFIQGDNSLSVAGKAADAKKTGDEIADLKEALTDVSATKADKDGTVASAEQLLSDVGTEDKAPYLFRATPYDSTRVDEEVVGATVGWNQIMPTTYKSGSKTFDEDASYYGAFYIGLSLPITPNHIYFCAVKVTRNIATNDGVGIAVTSGSNTIISPKLNNGAPNGFAYAIKSSGECNTITGILWNNYPGKRGFASGDSVAYDNLMLIDLTAWFGSAIADYALSLEQATAGSGVAWIKALLPGGYIPYSAPGLASVSGLSGHKFVGFNWWDEIAEEGGISTSTGLNIAQTGRFRPKNYIPVFPGMTYNFLNKAHHNISLYYYRKDKSFVTSVNLGSAENSLITIADDVYYVRFVDPATAVYTPGDICFNVSDATLNGQYKPYEAPHEYALDSDLTLRGILKMDSDHNVYADGDVYKADGTVTRRYAEVDLGTLTWGKQTVSSRWYFYAEIPNLKVAEMRTLSLMNARYTTITDGRAFADCPNLSIYNTYLGADYRVAIIDDRYLSATDFEASLDGLKLVYPLQTPTTEEAEPFTSPQNCAVGGTEEYVYAEGGSGVLVGHNSKYLKNMRSELERVSVAVPDAPSANGTYTLKATVSSGTVTYAWVSD